VIGLILLVIATLFVWWIWELRHRRTHRVPPGLQQSVELPFEHEFELYHNAFSLCSKKVRVCLAELEIDHGSHHVDLIETGSYENLSRVFLGVNPEGTVPVLVHQGHPVYQSHDQIRYAADHAPGGGPSLVPETSDQIQEMQTWVDRASLTGDDPIAETAESAGNCVPGLTVPLFCAMIADIPVRRILVGVLFHRLRTRPLLFLAMKIAGLRRLSGMKPAARIIRRSVRDMNIHLDALESRLQAGGEPWILGECFSLADVSWVVIFDRMREADCADLFLGDGLRPRTTAYRDRLFARSSYAKGIWNHEHPTVVRGTQRLREAKQANPKLRAVLAGELLDSAHS